MSIPSQQCQLCSNISTSGKYCEKCRRKLLTELDVIDVMCERCRINAPKNRGSKYCNECDELCEYCADQDEAKKADPTLKGCGKKICKECDEGYPYVRCLICYNWHRMTGSICKDCYENRKPNPPSDSAELKVYNEFWQNNNCYGTCGMRLKGYEAICLCRYNNFRNKYILKSD